MSQKQNTAMRANRPSSAFSVWNLEAHAPANQGGHGIGPLDVYWVLGDQREKVGGEISEILAAHNTKRR